MSYKISKNQILQMMSEPPAQGKRQLEPLKTLAKENGLPINILEDTEVANKAEVHTHEGDLWLCLDGEVTFTCGGKLTNPQTKKNKDGTVDERELKGDSIEGGKDIEMTPGDWLWIEAGEPHSHRAEKTCRLAIIKIPKS